MALAGRPTLWEIFETVVEHISTKNRWNKNSAVVQAQRAGGTEQKAGEGGGGGVEGAWQGAGEGVQGRGGGVGSGQGGQDQT